MMTDGAPVAGESFGLLLFALPVLLMIVVPFVLAGVVVVVSFLRWRLALYLAVGRFGLTGALRRLFPALAILFVSLFIIAIQTFQTFFDGQMLARWLFVGCGLFGVLLAAVLRNLVIQSFDSEITQNEKSA